MKYGVLTLALVICLGACESQFVKPRIEGAMPEPTIHLARKFWIAQFGVEKIIPVKGQDNDKVEYWGGVAKSAKEEVYTSEIRYGHVPEGLYEHPSARPLDYGYYSIYIAASAHRIAGGAFLILRDKLGKLSIMNINSYNHKNELITCVDDAMYYEDAVKSHCLTQEYLGGFKDANRNIVRNTAHSRFAELEPLKAACKAFEVLSSYRTSHPFPDYRRGWFFIY